MEQSAVFGRTEFTGCQTCIAWDRFYLDLNTDRAGTEFGGVRPLDMRLSELTGREFEYDVFIIISNLPYGYGAHLIHSQISLKLHILPSYLRGQINSSTLADIKVQR